MLHEVAHSGHGEGMLKVVCYFCIDNFAWPSGDNIPLDKVQYRKSTLGKVQYRKSTLGKVQYRGTVEMQPCGLP